MSGAPENLPMTPATMAVVDVILGSIDGRATDDEAMIGLSYALASTIASACVSETTALTAAGMFHDMSVRFLRAYFAGGTVQ